MQGIWSLAACFSRFGCGFVNRLRPINANIDVEQNSVPVAQILLKAPQQLEYFTLSDSALAATAPASWTCGI